MRYSVLFLLLVAALVAACNSPAPAPVVDDAAGAQVVTVYHAPT